jgi:hypothetical protein
MTRRVALTLLEQRMKLVSIILTVATCTCGLVAAYYWRRSSKVQIDPMWKVEPADAMLSQMGWTAGTVKAMTDSADLNKLASAWSAAAAALGAIASMTGALA